MGRTRPRFVGPDSGLAKALDVLTGRQDWKTGAEFVQLHIGQTGASGVEAHNLHQNLFPGDIARALEGLATMISVSVPRHAGQCGLF